MLIYIYIYICIYIYNNPSGAVARKSASFSVMGSDSVHSSMWSLRSSRGLEGKGKRRKLSMKSLGRQGERETNDTSERSRQTGSKEKGAKVRKWELTWHGGSEKAGPLSTVQANRDNIDHMEQLNWAHLADSLGCKWTSSCGDLASWVPMRVQWLWKWLVTESIEIGMRREPNLCPNQPGSFCSKIK